MHLQFSSFFSQLARTLSHSELPPEAVKAFMDFMHSVRKPNRHIYVVVMVQ